MTGDDVDSVNVGDLAVGNDHVGALASGNSNPDARILVEADSPINKSISHV